MNKIITEYIKNLPEHRAEKLKQLHYLIHSIYPMVVIDMQYKMPTYHQCENWIAIASQKNYVSLYTCGYHNIKAFSDKHPLIKTGKGCINFKDNDPMPLEDIKQVIQSALGQSTH